MLPSIRSFPSVVLVSSLTRPSVRQLTETPLSLGGMDRG